MPPSSATVASTATIHPSAIVSPQAQIGQACVVGPYCVVGPHVRLGDGSELKSHVVLDGRLTIGQQVQIYPFACIGGQTQDLKYRGGVGQVTVGDRTILREYVTIHQPTFEDGLTCIGSDCAVLAYSHIAHDCRLGNGIVMSNGVQIAGHVTVEDFAVFGGLAGVAQFLRVGTMAMVGACAKLVQDATPFCLLDGTPATPRAINKIGMQRRGLSEAEVAIMNKVYRLFFRSNLSSDEALSQIVEQFPESICARRFVDFAAATEHGVARPLAKPATG